MEIDANFISQLRGRTTTGIYVLLLFVSEEITLTIGKLGINNFTMGYYSYTGSAFGNGATSLKNRIRRHLSKEKRKFWHIDYLLADERVSIEAVIVAETYEKVECETNQYIKKTIGAKVPIMGFGSSDCRKNCGSHLLYFSKIQNKGCLVQKIVKQLESVFGILSVYVLQ
jgi:Uri superfamily endonuclease